MIDERRKEHCVTQRQPGQDYLLLSRPIPVNNEYGQHGAVTHHEVRLSRRSVGTKAMLVINYTLRLNWTHRSQGWCGYRRGSWAAPEGAPSPHFLQHIFSRVLLAVKSVVGSWLLPHPLTVLVHHFMCMQLNVPHLWWMIKEKHQGGGRLLTNHTEL